MNESDIVQTGDPVLREVAQPVAAEDIESSEVKEIISNMKAALADTSDGVAIAAPQVGEPVRIFVVAGAVFSDRNDTPSEDKVFINPEIINTSKKTVVLDEGCLSVRWKYGKVERFAQATVEALDETGEKFQMGASGLLAQIFQHETDHLNGTLFIDKATDLRDIDPPTENHEKAA